MEIKDITKEWLEDQYKTKSFKQIAEELGTYRVKIQRLAKKFGIPPRSMSEAQTRYLLTTDNHPTRGKSRPEATRVKISRQKTVSDALASDEIKQKRVERARQLWENKTQAEKDTFIKQGIDGCREAAKTGSKLEKYLQNKLTLQGYNIECHQEQYLVNKHMHIDIFIPSLRTVIEVDGPSHYRNIWGPERLIQTRRADLEKNGSLLTEGYVVIRIVHINDDISVAQMDDIWQQLAYHLQKITTTRLNYHERFIEIRTKFNAPK